MWETPVSSNASPSAEEGTLPLPDATRREPHRLGRIGVMPAGVILLVAAIVLSVAVGSRLIPFGEAIGFLLHPDSSAASIVIWRERVPRTIAALTVGAALGVSGALIQALTRNPLADPGILGVNAGAALFVAVGVAVLGVSSAAGYVWLAVAGALLVTLVVYAIGSSGRGPLDPGRLTLAGVALGAVLAGIVTAMTLLDPEAFDRMRHWNAGSFVNRGLDITLPVLPVLFTGLLLAVRSTRALNMIAVGDDLARALGTNVVGTRVLVIIAVTLLAGGATAIAGPVAFVGLMIPHIARWIVGPDQRWIIGVSLLLGPVLVLIADILGRVVLRSGEVPMGIVTAFVGAPVLIILVRRKRVSGL